MIQEEKQQLRNKLKEKRAALSNDNAALLSRKISDQLIDFVQWEDISNVNIYKSITKNNEVDTTRTIKFIRSNHHQVEISFPDENQISQAKKYDLCVVPLLVFDDRGYRLGYGGGYYDKFLTQNQCKQTIGLAYSFSQIEKIPNEAHDQKLEFVVTENGIISF